MSFCPPSPTTVHRRKDGGAELPKGPVGKASVRGGRGQLLVPSDFWRLAVSLVIRSQPARMAQAQLA